MTSSLPDSRHSIRAVRPRRRAGGLGNSVLGNIYEALTGLRPVPSAFIRRAVANGLDANLLKEAIARARSAHKLPDYLAAMAERKLERALYWDELGLKSRAGENYLESAIWNIYAELLTGDPVKKHELYRQYSSCYAAAAPYFAVPALSIDTGFIASSLSGYLRVPLQENVNGKHPCVILLNNFCSPKEELHYVENALAARGFATLTVEYPGQVGSLPPAPFDVRELGNSLTLFLSTRTEIDCSRVSLYGISLGARIALCLAIIFPERFHSVVSICAPYNLSCDLDYLTPAYARELVLSTLATRGALLDLARQTPIEDQLAGITMPVLVAGGGKDIIALPEEARHIFEELGSTDKKLLLCPGARHNLYEMMPSIRYEIAEWLWQRS